MSIRRSRFRIFESVGEAKWRRDGALRVYTAAFVLAVLFSQVIQPPTAAAQTASSVAHLQQLLDQHNYIEFAQELPHAAGLTQDQQNYFSGVLAFRQGHLGSDDVVKPLASAVNAKTSALSANQVEDALEILGLDAAKTYHYAASAQMYQDIDVAFGAAMGDTVKPIRERRHIAVLLLKVPPQTIGISGDFSLKKTADGYPISIGGKTFSAGLDTGAAYSVVSESTAARWGLTPLDGTATLHGYGSGAFQAHPAVIPVLQMGKAELHNVVVMVTADQNLFIPEIKLQINALLGYPVASALGRLTFSKDGTLTVSAQSPAPGQENGAGLWVGDSFLLAAVNTIPVFEGGKVTGSTGTRLFALDTGSGSSFLTDRYLAEHRNVFTGPPSSMARLAGAGGGIHEIPAYTANHLPLWFGSTLVLSTGPHVLTQTQGGEVEAYYGLIGQDILQIFSSYTIDFRTMTFSVKP
jgi:hypothetical protein